MRIELRFNEDVAILALSGKFLAGSDGPYLRQKVKDLIEAGARKFVIDFADVPYIDSTGLGFLAGARVTAQNAGARIVLASLGPHVRRILDEVKLTQFFVIAADEPGAMALLSQPELPREMRSATGENKAKSAKGTMPAAHD